MNEQDRVYWVGAPRAIGTVLRVREETAGQTVFVDWDNEQSGNWFFTKALRLA